VKIAITLVVADTEIVNGITCFHTAFHQASIDGPQPSGSSTHRTRLHTTLIYSSSATRSSTRLLWTKSHNATSVSIYLPWNRFDDFATFVPVDGTKKHITLMLSDIGFRHIRGGAVLPLSTKGAMTTTELRAQLFQFVIAPSTDGMSKMA
jgi:hypothetical protein